MRLPLLAIASLGLVSAATAAEPVTALLVSGKDVTTTVNAVEAHGGASVIVNRTGDSNLQVSADSIRIAGGIVRCQGHVRVVDHTVAIESPSDLTLNVGTGAKVFLLNPAGIIVK